MRAAMAFACWAMLRQVAARFLTGACSVRIRYTALAEARLHDSGVSHRRVAVGEAGIPAINSALRCSRGSVDWPHVDLDDDHAN
jgi:hypothetical protein